MVLFALLACVTPFFAQNSFAAPNPWALVKTPAPGPAESIGTPTAGCIKGAEPLNKNARGIVLAHPERHRIFGHPKLIKLLSEVAESRVHNKLAPLYMGDVGQARGGPTMSAHASHESGLDADIQYAGRAAVGMVDTKKLKVTKQFGPVQVALLKSFADQAVIDRILVHYAIKRELCDHHAQESWIRKIRPWYGHDHHFHIRIKCAPTDQKCKEGEPIPDGNGCDSTLDWWWSADAKNESKKNLHKQTHPVMPELPAECKTLIQST